MTAEDRRYAKMCYICSGRPGIGGLTRDMETQITTDPVSRICGTASPYTFDIAGIRRLFPESSCISMDDDLCVVDLRYLPAPVLRTAYRFDGFIAFFCISGRLRISINMTEYDMRENTILVNLPGNIVSLTGNDDHQAGSPHFVIMAMTRAYMQSIKVDINRLAGKGAILFGNPCFVLSEEEREVAKDYLKLAVKVLRSGLKNRRECISSLISSIFYLAGGMMEQKVSDAVVCNDRHTERSKEIFSSFLSLVVEHHSRERGVAFYADRLCLTPKYLSKLVKNVSGYSAPEWIDAYVILEAKSMLMYSDCTVKQIVADLNFPNPSAFNKFFKKKTGMTPVQYRKL